MKLLLTHIFFLTVVIVSNADTLSLQQSIQRGLKENYNIVVAQNNQNKSQNNRKLKVGVFLPVVKADGTIQYRNQTSEGASGVLPGGGGSVTVEENTVSAGVSLGWTLFDGFRMFHAGQLIDRQIELSAQATRQTIESFVVQTITAYTTLRSAQVFLEAAEKQLLLSKELLARMQDRYAYGRVGQRQLLYQEVQMNADSSLKATRELDVVQARHQLNLLIGLPPDSLYDIVLPVKSNYEEHDASWYWEKARTHNAGLQLAEIQKNIAASQLGIEKASLWPVLSASGSYTRTWGDAESERLLGGVSLSMPILSGFTRVAAIQNAKIDTDNARLTYQQEQRELKAHIFYQWERMNVARKQIEFEKKSVAAAQKSLAINQSQYRLGNLSLTDLRESQLALLQAEIRLESAQFQSRITHAQLKQLAGVLQVE